MPGDLRTSPWKPTRRRQDFMEELYLNITIANRNIGDDMNSRVENSPPGGVSVSDHDEHHGWIF